MSSALARGLNEPRSGRRFATVDEAFSRDSAYWGEHGDWFIVASQHRDSDTLTESNFQVLRERLGDSAAVERAGHWAVGWVEYLIVAPDDHKGLRVAIKAAKALDDYPVLDDEHFSGLEHEKFWSFARSELEQFDGWEKVLSDLMYDGDYYVGDEGSEWDAIEAARKQLDPDEEA